MDTEKNINQIVNVFKKELIETINNSGLPAVLVYEILNGLTLQLKNQMQAELYQDGNQNT